MRRRYVKCLSVLRSDSISGISGIISSRFRAQGYIICPSKNGWPGSDQLGMHLQGILCPRRVGSACKRVGPVCRSGSFSRRSFSPPSGFLRTRGKFPQEGARTVGGSVLCATPTPWQPHSSAGVLFDCKRCHLSNIGTVSPSMSMSVCGCYSPGDPGRRVVFGSLCVVFLRWIVAPFLKEFELWLCEPPREHYVPPTVGDLSESIYVCQTSTTA